MKTGSPLKHIKFQSNLIQQTDLLIQTLLQFGLIHPNDSSTTPQITHLNQDQINLSLEKLNISSKFEQNHDSIDPTLKKIIKSHVYHLHSSYHNETLSIRSWNMTEHVYRQQPCPFPTMARGLFIQENVHPDLPIGSGRHRIVVRGYDKFFSINEVPSTKWDTLQERTKPPYHLTLKTNGCIILIAALTPVDLLVTSKHATVDSNSVDRENSVHSAMGDRWVNRHLEKVGMSRTDLASELWAANATAVAELTDDDFEEHVIPTPLDEIGLNLHGINLNTAQLLTYPPDVVAQCAKRWGMHPTPFTTVNDIESVVKHCQIIENQGWSGREGHVEGVVVRGTPQDVNVVENCSLPTCSVFWKVKFEEPYLTYREWREITRKILHQLESHQKVFKESCQSRTFPLNLKDSEEIAALLRVNVKKIHKPETRLYVHWVIEELFERPNTFELWGKNRGIVTTRLAFFEWRKSALAAKIIQQLVSSKSTLTLAHESINPDEQKFDKNLLVPIGIPGCGKTTLSVALTNLINCAHTQSDDVTTKKTGPTFIENVKNLLLQDSGPKLVIADKNNHLKTHREALVEMCSKLRRGIQIKTREKHKNLRETRFVQLNTRLIAMTWDLDKFPASELHQFASQRIVERGDNHQTLRPLLTAGGIEAHDAILWRFLKSYEELDGDINHGDQEFHHVIELKFKDSLEYNLKRLCDQLKSIIPDIFCGLDLTDERFEQSLQIAKAYKPLIKQEIKLDSTLIKPRYFGIKFDTCLKNLIQEIFKNLTKNDDSKTVTDGLNFFLELCNRNRITPVPHITIIHQNEILNSMGKDHEKLNGLWSHCQDLILKGNQKFTLELGPKLVWNSRVMVIQAKIQNSSSEETIQGLKIENEGYNSHSEDHGGHYQQRYHVTIGTLDESIRAIEGLHLLNHLFSHLHGGSSPPEGSTSTPDDSFQFIDVQSIKIDGVLKGLT